MNEDDSRTLYAAITNLTNSLAPVIDSVPQMLGSLNNLDSRLSGIESTQNEMLNTLLAMVMTGDQTAESVVGIGERTSRTFDLVEGAAIARAASADTLNSKVDTVRETLPTVLAALDALAMTAVPGTVTDGKIDALTDSHNQILLLVGSIKDDVTPLLDALQGSPVLKMLGVK